MRVPPNAMRRLVALEQAAIDATRRRDEAVALVLAAIDAPGGSRIILQNDGSGAVVFPEEQKDSESYLEDAADRS